MRVLNTLKDFNTIFGFDFYLYLNQAIRDMGLVIASPSFTFAESEHLKNHPTVSDLKHKIQLFETVQKPDEEYVTDEMFKNNYIVKLDNDITFFNGIPAIKIEEVDTLYNVKKESIDPDKKEIDTLSLTENIPTDSMTQISIQLFDENEKELLQIGKELPERCLTPFDERVVILFSNAKGTHIFANKEFEWIKNYKEKVNQEIETEESFERE